MFPGLAGLALEVSGAALRFEHLPELFSRDLRQISPNSNDELLDLYGRSEQILANRFTFFNLTEEFGAEINWEQHPSPGWRASLHAFDYGLDLAMTYRISRDERYARHLRYLMAEWIAANPPGQGSGWNPRTLARRVRNWVLAADLARDDWQQDPIFLSLVVESLALQTAYLSQQSEADISASEDLDCAGALNLAGRFFVGYAATELASQAIRMVLGTRSDQRWPASQLRRAETLIDFMLFTPAENTDLHNQLKAELLESLRTLEGMLWPDGTLPLFGPSAEAAPERLSNLFAIAAIMFEEPHWKSLAGDFGVAPYLLIGEKGKACFESLPHQPANPDVHCSPKCGLYSLAGKDLSKLFVKESPADESPAHEDFLSYDLYTCGQRVVVDSGAFSPEGEIWNPYFPSPLAHNTLLVDGRGTDRSAWRGHILHESQVDCSSLRAENSGFKSLGLDHVRAWYCLDGQYWVVLDRLLASEPHRYRSLIHFYPTFSIDRCAMSVLVRSRSLTFTLIPLGATSPEMNTFQGDHPEFPSWYSPDFGFKMPAAALHLEWTFIPPSSLSGYLLVPGSEVDFRPIEVDPHAGKLGFELFGKRYNLTI
ncbi:MAG: heparinase II/III family protein [Terriglobia bacterium]